MSYAPRSQPFYSRIVLFSTLERDQCSSHTRLKAKFVCANHGRRSYNSRVFSSEPIKLQKHCIWQTHIHARRRIHNGSIPKTIPRRDRDDAQPVYPTVVQQARDNMRKFDKCVLLTRVGSFYEVCISST